MCVDEYGILFCNGEKSLAQKDLCNKDLALSRGLICQALSAFSAQCSKTVYCLDGNSFCGLMGMLWKKHMSGNVRVEINGVFDHSPEVIRRNLEKNHLEVNVTREDPCVLLRKNFYDFIFINCKTSASHYLDSIFSKARDGTIVAITTSEDPSLYWQSPSLALRNYGGSVARTSYFRELGIRLVIAEMARAAARYSKSLTVLCSAAFKTQQSFTIIVKVTKGPEAAVESVKNIKKLLHCSVCEDRAFVPNSDFPLESPASLLSCTCSKTAKGKVVIGLGPVWSGPIFSADFVEAMLSLSRMFPWQAKIKMLLIQILDEAKCQGGNLRPGIPPAKVPRLEDQDKLSEDESQPSFYFNTHRHHPPNQQLMKVSAIVQILRNSGYRASRTHFDPGSVRTNASLQDYIQVLGQHQ